MRAIWKGAVSFGLVSIGVKLYSATEEKDIRFHQVHREDGGRIRYKRVCSVDGEEVAYDDIAKGYDLGGGEMVILTDEDFADLPLTTSPGDRRAAVRAGRAGRPDPLRQGLLPGAGETGDQAVRAAARRARATPTGWRIVKVALRPAGAAGHAAGARRRAGAQHDAVAGRGARPRTSASSTRTSTVRPQELAMAESLIESMAGDFDPDGVSPTTTGRRCSRSSTPRSRAARSSSSRSRRRPTGRSST